VESRFAARFARKPGGDLCRPCPFSQPGPRFRRHPNKRIDFVAPADQDSGPMNTESRPSMKTRMVHVFGSAAESREQISGGSPVPEDTETGGNAWTSRLVLFLRIMAVIAMAKGLYHWAEITGFIGSEDTAFEVQTTQWQSATVYFAVIELVAAVGLWLAMPWGAVVWLTSVVSMAVIELMFPAIYGSNYIVVILALVLLVIYLALAWMAARERPP
jgi:hypothetical protein